MTHGMIERREPTAPELPRAGRLAVWALVTALAACAPEEPPRGGCESRPETGDACSDGCSNDADALADCDDPDCVAEAACAIGCGDGRTACAESCVELSSSPSHCGRCEHACGAAEICMSGACVPLPECPPEGCPLGSICDLASNRCVSGCLADSGCVTGQICESRTCADGCRSDGACGTERICDAMTCRIGCRSDGACGGGRICEGSTCRVGCRAHADCGTNEVCDLRALVCVRGCLTDDACDPDQICESLACRMGCRLDPDCGAGSTCVASSMTCAACAADPDEPGDPDAPAARTDTAGDEYWVRTREATVMRVLCGPDDFDSVHWHYLEPPGAGSFIETISVDIAGAEPTSSTRLYLYDAYAAILASEVIAGSGSTTLRTVGGESTGSHFRFAKVEVMTDSETPVTATVHLSWVRR